MNKTNKKLLLILVIVSSIFSLSYAQQADIDSECTDLKTNLRLRSSDNNQNKDVTKLQKYLFENKFLNISPTGFFGSKTKQAVSDYQRSVNLIGTGFVGPLTRAEIKKDTCDGNVSDSSTSSTTTSSVSARCPDGSLRALVVVGPSTGCNSIPAQATPFQGVQSTNNSSFAGIQSVRPTISINRSPAAGGKVGSSVTVTWSTGGATGLSLACGGANPNASFSVPLSGSASAVYTEAMIGTTNCIWTAVNAGGETFVISDPYTVTSSTCSGPGVGNCYSEIGGTVWEVYTTTFNFWRYVGLTTLTPPSKACTQDNLNERVNLIQNGTEYNFRCTYWYSK